MITKFKLYEQTYQEYLYHGTSDINLNGLLKNGMVSPSYWTNNEDMADYYANGEVEEKGGNPIIIKIPFLNFKISKLEVDYNSVSEPITTVLGASEDDLKEEWESSNGKWTDSLEIYGSVRYNDYVKISIKDIS